MNENLSSLESLLSGGDLRSIGLADRAAHELARGVRKPEEFMRLLEGSEGVVRMRAADALEKASRESPELISRMGDRLLALLASEQPKEVRWHLLQMCSRVRWPANLHKRVLRAIEDAFLDRSAIVKASALEALWQLAPHARMFSRAYEDHVQAARASSVPSLRARARKLSGRNGVQPFARADMRAARLKR